MSEEKMEFGVGFVAGGLMIGWAVTHLSTMKECATKLEKAGASKCRRMARALLGEK